jgi:Na+-transporting NADH:ubiquinone oxidoreductase subunit NqrE
VALGANLVWGFIDMPAALEAPWMLALISILAIAMFIGLFTPVTATLSAIAELAIGHFSSGAIAALHICAMLVAVALAMLGPGAYSLDAKLFGRQQMIFPSSDGPDDE